ncbi:hypothetical protein HK096_000316, partial [Nowakowskiella sp. JEL0078]
PEPLAKLYTRSFFRATWLLTGMDAGFLTAMEIRPKWLRDMLSIVFSLYFIAFPDHAEETVRKFRANATVRMMRVSWEKAKNPYLRAVTFWDRAFVGIRKEILIPRPNLPSASSFNQTELKPVKALLLFSGTKEELSRATRVIIQFPGGGFITMDPKCHEDYLSMWAKQTKIPIVSIDYGKAPEFPYPWALEECFDAYRSIVESNGEVIGLEGWYKNDSNGRPLHPKTAIKIVLEGDSAGGNLVVGVVIKCLEARDIRIPAPCAVMLLYPCLSFDMACWMPSNELNLIRAESSKSLRTLIDAKSKLNLDSPLAHTEAPRSINVLTDKVDRSRSWYKFWESKIPKVKPSIPTSLSMTSRMSYFTDKLIAPELLRAMAMLYLGQSPNAPDFEQDYFLSPIVAPDEILARFPKTFLLCGEKDPFVDDTVVFAGRLRDAKTKAHKEWERLRQRVTESTNSNPNITSIKSRNPSLPPQINTERSDTDEELEEVENSDSSKDEEEITGKQPLPFIINNEELSHHLFARNPDKMVRVKILEGMSHAILQMTGLMLESRQATHLTGSWFLEMFYNTDAENRQNRLNVPENEALTDFMINEIQEIDSANGVTSRNSTSSLNRVNSTASMTGMLQTPLTTAMHIGGYYPLHGASSSQDHTTVLARSQNQKNAASAGKNEVNSGKWQKISTRKVPDVFDIEKKRLDEVQETTLMERRRAEMASNSGLY